MGSHAGLIYYGLKYFVHHLRRSQPLAGSSVLALRKAKTWRCAMARSSDLAARRLRATDCSKEGSEFCSKEGSKEGLKEGSREGSEDPKQLKLNKNQ